MASSILLRRSSATTANLLNKFLQPTSITPSISRSFNTSVQRRESSDDESDIDNVSGRRSGRVFAPSIFTDVFDPFSFSSPSLSQVLSMANQLAESPFSTASRGMGTNGVRRGWDAKESNEGLQLRIDMPGLGKENVKISVEDQTLMIKGEGEKEGENEESGRRYSSRIGLPPKVYKIDGIKAEMKNGVLKVFVPKVKEEDKKVHQVMVD